MMVDVMIVFVVVTLGQLAALQRESQDYKIRGESDPFKVQRIEICILINC